MKYKKAIKKLQRSLKRMGYPLTIDGKLGIYTMNAVRCLQKDNGLMQDGIVGDKTIKLLNLDNKTYQKIKTVYNQRYDKIIMCGNNNISINFIKNGGLL